MNIKYTNLKAIILSKNLLWQYVEDNGGYDIFAYDNQIGYVTRLHKAGFEPIGCNCAADLADFETNYKPTANVKLEDSVKYLTRPSIGVTKADIGTRAWVFSHSFTDKTTWFGDSTRITDEAVGTGDGATIVFNLANQYVIDLSHGKVSDEDYLVDTYSPVVKVGSTTKTEVPFGETTGDYTIDYVNGTITFVAAPATGQAITASYSYSPSNSGSVLYVRPTPGKKLIVTVAETQLAKNFVMTDNMITAIWTYNPSLGAPPAKFEYPGSRSRYKKIMDFINYTLGAFPIIPNFSTGVRNLPHDILHLRYDYQTAFILDSAYGAELRVWMEHHRPYEGESATITFYGYEE